MAHPHARRLLSLLLASLTTVVLTSAAVACPFCSQERGPTLVTDFNTAAMVLLGTFTNARADAKDGAAEGTTEFVIAEVLKKHDVLGNKKKITLPRYLPQAKNQYLIFCDVYKGTIDPYRAAELPPGSELAKYLKGAMAIKDRPLPERLRYAFDYLNSSETEVALDAYREYAVADYKDYKDMARSLPPAVLAKWLRDPKTPPYRFGLYGSLLGLCGHADDAKLLHDLVQDPQKRVGGGLDGMLAGYITIDSKGGWQYLTGILKDKKQEFLIRYAGLRTIRFLWDQRPDLIPKTDLVKGVALLLDDPNMADFSIEELRKWQQWTYTDRVLDLFAKDNYSLPVVRRAILRFALQSNQPRASAFVTEQRRRDAEWVSDTEELLRLEAQPPATPTK